MNTVKDFSLLASSHENQQQESGSTPRKRGIRQVPRPTPDVQIIDSSKNAMVEPLKLSSTEPRDHGTPLADSRRADVQSLGHIRGGLVVIDGGLLEHSPSLTLVHGNTQPRFKTKMLTLVNMSKLETLAERLKDAMEKCDVSNAELARACNVSSPAVGKWLAGGKLTADNLAATGRALGVREEWLRTGRLPRDRDEQEQAMDNVMALLHEIRAPLTALVEALNRLPEGGSALKRKGGP